ncbi:MAG TPA: GntR family transcriptional regulator [Steroidobacteraceae bacterium]|nr:GntR family transcriptional regulator [Steroidobacteraceae bacterium]
MADAARATTTSDIVAESLRKEIAGGWLRPGSPLRQEAIADRLGVSRMPVRDALSQLHAEGLVDLLPNRGAFVSSMSAEECVELFDLRVMLECDALERAVAHHTDSSLRELRYIQGELEVATDRESWAAGDRRFHTNLYQPCGRPRTLRIIAELRNRVERFYLAALSPDDRRSAWRGEHRDILSAVGERDAAAACGALRRHLRETQAVVLAKIQQRD